MLQHEKGAVNVYVWKETDKYINFPSLTAFFKYFMPLIWKANSWKGVIGGNSFKYLVFEIRQKS